MKKTGRSLLVILLASFFVTGCSRLPAASQQSPSPSPTSSPVTETFGSSLIARALQNGGTISCTINKKSESKQMSMILDEQKILLSGNNMIANGSTGNLIADTRYVYIWEDGKMTGWKTILPTQQDLSIILTEVREKYGVNIPNPNDPNAFLQLESEGYDVKCQETVATESVFIPPQDVQFTDITPTIQKLINEQRTISPSPVVSS